MPGWDIDGPLDILIIGEDTRVSSATAPHNDTNVVLHVSRDLKSAYMTSLATRSAGGHPCLQAVGFRRDENQAHPRDHLGLRGQRGECTPVRVSSLSFRPSVVTPASTAFDAGVLFSFHGMRDFVDEIGGIDIYVDRNRRSIHRQPNGKPRPLCGSCANGYGGPQQVYQAGMRHLVGWQALDYARQRYRLNGGAYGRERHHRQIVRAVMAQLFKQDLVLNPVKADKILKAVGRGVIFDGRGRTPIRIRLRTSQPSP